MLEVPRQRSTQPPPTPPCLADPWQHFVGDMPLNGGSSTCVWCALFDQRFILVELAFICMCDVPTDVLHREENPPTPSNTAVYPAAIRTVVCLLPLEAAADFLAAVPRCLILASPQAYVFLTNTLHSSR